MVLQKDISFVVDNYRKLLSACYHSLDKTDKKNVRIAYRLLVNEYQCKKMESGDYYISHAVEVTLVVVEEIGLTSDSIVRTLLHNILTNTNVSLTDIEKQFSKNIAETLNGYTKISRLSTQRTSLNAENFIKLLLTISGDVRVILIRLADRLEYMRKMDRLPEKIKHQVAVETAHLYAPIAHRLGLYHIKTELDELSMKYAQPKIYNDIRNKLIESSDAREAYITEFIDPIAAVLDNHGFQCDIKGRVKSISSIWEKMKLQHVDLDEVYDLFAIRIINKKTKKDEKNDCWEIYSIVTNIFQPNPKRLRDWITTPKASGYESLHTTVIGPHRQWVEVQIRSARMDEVAEKGGASHWLYKEPAYRKDKDTWVNKIREQLENPQINGLIPAQLSKMELYSENIFVFTPAGDLKKLPLGATVLDFAFEVHTNVGSQCTGARVNNKIEPIRYILKNGDQVEIITSKNQKPKADWIKIAKTSKARAKIKKFIKELQYDKADEGKEMLKRKLSQLKLSFNNNTINQLLNYFNITIPIDLYHRIATGKIDVSEIKGCFFHTVEEESLKDSNLVPEVEPDKRPLVSSPTELLLIDGKADLHDYKFANCCMPVYGDDIFGFVTVDKGIKIHRVNCPNAIQMRLRYSYRVIDVKWVAAGDDSPVLAGLKITGTNEPGIVNRISSLLTDKLKMSIHTFSFTSNKNKIEGEIKTYMKDSRQLDYLISQILKIDGVKKVSRIK